MNEHEGGDELIKTQHKKAGQLNANMAKKVFLLKKEFSKSNFKELIVLSVCLQSINASNSKPPTCKKLKSRYARSTFQGPI